MAGANSSWKSPHYKHFLLCLLKKVDVVLMGRLIIELLEILPAELSLIEGSDYRALPKDQSQLMSTLGTLNKEANGHLFKFPIYEKGISHVSIDTKERMECDDTLTQSGFTSAGSWHYYIR